MIKANIKTLIMIFLYTALFSTLSGCGNSDKEEIKNKKATFRSSLETQDSASILDKTDTLLQEIQQERFLSNMSGSSVKAKAIGLLERIKNTMLYISENGFSQTPMDILLKVTGDEFSKLHFQYADQDKFNRYIANILNYVYKEAAKVGIELDTGVIFTAWMFEFTLDHYDQKTLGGFLSLSSATPDSGWMVDNMGSNGPYAVSKKEGILLSPLIQIKSYKKDPQIQLVYTEIVSGKDLQNSHDLYFKVIPPNDFELFSANFKESVAAVASNLQDYNWAFDDWVKLPTKAWTDQSGWPKGESAPIDLSAYEGKSIVLAFFNKKSIPAEGSKNAGWEILNLKIKTNQVQTKFSMQIHNKVSL